VVELHETGRETTSGSKVLLCQTLAPVFIKVARCPAAKISVCLTGWVLSRGMPGIAKVGGSWLIVVHGFHWGIALGDDLLEDRCASRAEFFLCCGKLAGDVPVCSAVRRVPAN